jgi:hypothetical protein
MGDGTSEGAREKEVGGAVLGVEGEGEWGVGEGSAGELVWGGGREGGLGWVGLERGEKSGDELGMDRTGLTTER